MTLLSRIEAFIHLGSFLKQFKAGLRNYDCESLNNLYFNQINEAINNSYTRNKWFTEEFVRYAIQSISKLLSKDMIEKWLRNYSIKDKNPPARIGVIMAGNIPFVGFHDMLTVLLSGNIFLGKQSSKDNNLLELISKVLIKIEPGFENRIIFIDERLKDFDAIIATGSNNTSRYFEYYFGKYPNIIRNNRNSIAILSGNEQESDLEKLADDVFLFYGLGCRSISKLFVPENYNFNPLIKVFQKYRYFSNHNGFMNNYDYNKSIYLMNSIDFYDCGFFILTQNEKYASPISVIYYEKYRNTDYITEQINLNSNQIQCIVSNTKNQRHISFGMAQHPELWDYADGIDTMNFLLNL